MTEYILVFTGFARTPGWCHVVVAEGGHRPAVLVGDLDDNPGTSVINATEEVAAEISRRLFKGEGPSAFTLFEYYAKGPPDLTPTFFRIDWAGEPDQFSMPTWTRVNADEEPLLRPLSDRVRPDHYTFDALTAERSLELIDASEPEAVVQRARSRTVGPEEFRIAMTPTITVLRALTNVVDEIADRYPEVNSQGFRELEAEPQFQARSTWEHPVADTHTFGRMTLRAAADHVRTFAEAFDATRPPTYGHLAVARAALEASVIASWLNEPGIAYLERIKRGMCERLYSAREVRDLQVQADADTTLRRYEEDAAGFGWQAVFDSDGTPSIDGTTRPSIPDGISRLIASGPSGDPGPLVWSRLSAVTHAVWWGLSWAFDFGEAKPSSPGMATVPIGAETAKVAIPALSILRALRATAAEQFTLMGWNEDPGWESVDRAAVAHEKLLEDLLASRHNQID
jgi:hypothetical protein